MLGTYSVPGPVVGDGGSEVSELPLENASLISEPLPPTMEPGTAVSGLSVLGHSLPIPFWRVGGCPLLFAFSHP